MSQVKNGLIAGMTVSLLLAAGGTQAGPGEDPVTITSKVVFTLGPMAPTIKSTDINYNRGIPDDVQAKIARYSAQAHTSNSTGISTERDVVQSVRTNGTQTTCVQSVGSNSIVTPGGGSVTVSGDQIVVLRGDMINICN